MLVSGGEDAVPLLLLFSLFAVRILATIDWPLRSRAEGNQLLSRRLVNASDRLPLKSDSILLRRALSPPVPSSRTTASINA